MPPAALEAFHAQFELLHRAGFDETRAAEALRAVFGYAVGWALMELSTFFTDIGAWWRSSASAGD